MRIFLDSLRWCKGLGFALRMAMLAIPSLALSQITLVNVTTCSPRVFPAACTIPSSGNGHLIAIGFTTDVSNTSITVKSMTDNVGNLYAEAGPALAVDTSLLTVMDIWYAKNSVSGATSITITPSTSVNGTAVIWEFSGIDPTAPLDQTSVLNSQPATTLVSGAAVTVASAPEVIISTANVSNSLTGVVAGNAFTNDSTTFASGWAHLITTAPGTYMAQWNQNSAGSYDASTVSFKASSTGPSFTLTAIPASQSITAGGNTAYTATVAPSGGFTGTVSLSASGLPAGTTAAFTPSSITTSGSSTLSISSTTSAVAGTYPITIKGTSGSITQNATVTLVISASGGSVSACDLNNDGSVNVVDVQLAVNKYLTCTAGPDVSSQAFVTQVTNGALGYSCSVAAGAHTAFLSWTASTTPGVNYFVYRASTSGAYTTPLNSPAIPGTAFADCSVVPGQTYYYVIRSVDGSGNLSANSAEVVAAIPST